MTQCPHCNQPIYQKDEGRWFHHRLCRDGASFIESEHCDGRSPLRPQSAEQQSLSQILEPKGSISNIPAIQSAIKFIEEDLAPRKCDSYGVSNCVRCTSVFLARTMAKILKAYARDAAPPYPESVSAEMRVWVLGKYENGDSLIYGVTADRDKALAWETGDVGQYASPFTLEPAGESPAAAPAAPLCRICGMEAFQSLHRLGNQFYDHEFASAERPAKAGE